MFMVFSGYDNGHFFRLHASFFSWLTVLTSLGDVVCVRWKADLVSRHGGLLRYALFLYFWHAANPCFLSFFCFRIFLTPWEGMGSGYLLFYGDKGYSAGYFNSDELWYGLAGMLNSTTSLSPFLYLCTDLISGAIVSLVSLSLFVFLVIWLVLRITFTFSPTHFRVLKTGLLRYGLRSLSFQRLFWSSTDFWLCQSSFLLKTQGSICLWSLHVSLSLQ